MKDYLDKEITSCQNEMEKHFLHLGEVFSTLMSQINQKTTTAEKVIRDYREHLTDTTGRNINVMIQFLEDNVNSLNLSLNQIDKELDDSINVLKNNLTQFHVVETNILSIKEFSELMELMALNSMVVAIKAGSRGGGFTYITEVLRKNANKTIVLTDELQELGQQLKINLGDLHNLLAELNDQRTKVLKKEETMNQSFVQFHGAMESFINFLDTLAKRSSEVRKNVLNVSEKISHQDIYRQSLDHISLIIKEMPEQKGNSDEDRLDILSYYEFLIEFSIPLLQEISVKLNDNIGIFEQETGEVNSSLKNIEISRKEYAAKNSNASKENCCIFYHVSIIDESLESLINSVRYFLKDIDSIAILNRSIMDRIINLEERNNRFERIIKAFRNVIIMGRIEVTKHDALKGVDVSVNDIAKITDQIDEKVNLASDAIDSVLVMNQSIVEKINILKGQISTFMNDFYGKIHKFREISTQGRITFNETMEHLDFYPSHFSKIFTSAIDASQELKEVTLIMQRLITNLEQNKSDFQIEKKNILNRLGIEKWDIKNENINRVLDKFTIYSQKSHALELSGEQKHGDSVEESSIVLF